MRRLMRLLVISAVGALTISTAVAGEKIRIAYWSSGFSIGFGVVLEQLKLVEAERLEPEYIKFTDINGSLKAVVTKSADVSFGSSPSNAMGLAQDDVPIQLIMGMQLGEAEFVAPADTKLKSLQDIKGKKVGVSAVGSATHAVAAAILEKNYGLKRSDYTEVPGSETKLAQFVALKEVDIAALRAVTIAQMKGTDLKSFGSFSAEWQRMTNSKGVPILGAGVVASDFVSSKPDVVARFIIACQKAVEFGARNPEKVAEFFSGRPI